MDLRLAHSAVGATMNRGGRRWRIMRYDAAGDRFALVPADAPVLHIPADSLLGEELQA